MIQKISEIRSTVLISTGVLLPLFRIMDDSKEDEFSCALSYGEKALWRNVYKLSTEPTCMDIEQSVAAAIKAHLSLFVNRHMVKLLLESLRESIPFAIEGVIPERISLSQMKQILSTMVRQGISIRNLARIIDIADDLIDQTTDIHEICLHISRAL